MLKHASTNQVRPFYEKRMGQEVEADTLGDEFKVMIDLNWMMHLQPAPKLGQCFHSDTFRDTFSASPEATTSRASR